MEFQFAFDTKASPQQVVAAFTDFTERRTKIWEKTLDPEKYEVREVGDTWAIVREGSATPSIWALERYDWSEPGTVKWTVQESNFCKPGSYVELRIGEAEHGASHVEGSWHRQASGLKGALIVTMGKVMGAKMIPSGYAAALDRYAEMEADGD